MLKHASSPSAFADIIPLLNHLPPAPPAADPAVLVAQLDQYHVKAGPLLPVLAHVQAWQKRSPHLTHPRLCAFASHYNNGSAQTEKTIQALQSDNHPLKQLAASLNADLRIYELDLAQTSRSPAQAAQAMTYGMLSIEDKGDVVVVASLSDGAEQAAQEWTLHPEQLADDLLHNVAAHLGLDFCAALGACLAARLAAQPVLVSGFFGEKLIAVLQALDEEAAAHVYLCDANDVTQTMAPVFTPVQILQQIRFVLAFLPAPLKTVHVRAAHANAV